MGAPGALATEEEQAKTLVHEQYHVGQLQAGMPYPKSYNPDSPFETEAKAFVNAWWDIREGKVTSMASFEQWGKAWNQAYHLSPERAAELRCPNCGVRALQLRFVTYRPGDAASMVFWCDKCLEGSLWDVARFQLPTRRSELKTLTFRSSDSCPPSEGGGGSPGPS